MSPMPVMNGLENLISCLGEGPFRILNAAGDIESGCHDGAAVCPLVFVKSGMSWHTWIKRLICCTELLGLINSCSACPALQQASYLTVRGGVTPRVCLNHVESSQDQQISGKFIKTASCAGSNEGRSPLQKITMMRNVGSVSGSVRQKSTCPCLVVRPAVRASLTLDADDLDTKKHT